jgi:hypothetical protein
MLLTLEFLTFTFTLWLGLYCFNRNPTNRPLRFAGLGTVTYAIALALQSLIDVAPPALSAALAQWRWPTLFLPLLCWLATLLYFRRDTSAQAKKSLGVILTATLFFGLGLGLLIFPLEWLPRNWMLLGISVDFVMLGLAIAFLDAFSEGETLLPDMTRSFISACFAVTIFSGLVTLALWGTGIDVRMALLWLAVTTAATLSQAFADPIQGFLDRFVFSGRPHLSQARAELRSIVRALPRTDDGVDLNALDDAEFVRLTRRAIGHMGDLSKLAASPLTRLPWVAERLARRGATDDTLERAVELKAMLAESIARLKPRGADGFGVSNEWRHYNALYFPYVVGLKPYSRRAEENGLDPTAHAALEWFRASVPERTLYNWQNAAAKLVAKDLRERTS